jgi:hypothetical protein
MARNTSALLPMLTKRTLEVSTPFFLQEGDHDLVQLRPQRADPDGLSRQVEHRLDFRLGGEHRLLARDAGARDDFHAGALLDGDQGLVEAGEHADVAASAHQGADQLGSVADRQDFRIDAEFLEIALRLHQLLHGDDLVPLGGGDPHRTQRRFGLRPRGRGKEPMGDHEGAGAQHGVSAILISRQRHGGAPQVSARTG